MLILRFVRSALLSDVVLYDDPHEGRVIVYCNSLEMLYTEKLCDDRDAEIGVKN